MEKQAKRDLSAPQVDMGQVSGDSLAQNVFDLAVSMGRALVAELQAERIYKLFRHIVDNNDGDTSGMASEHDYIGRIESYIEELEEQRGVEFDALQCARKQVRGWIERNSHLEAIALQALAEIMGVSLVSHDFRERKVERPEHDLDVAGRPLRAGT